MKYFKKLVGEKCFLSPLSTGDLDLYTHWVNDIEVTINVNLTEKILAKDNEREILEGIIRDAKNFAIVDITSEECIGTCGIIHVDMVNRNCEIGIIIGNKDYWSKGYGYEALNLLLEYCFNILNLNNVMLFVYSYNERAINCYKKCGFKEIGCRRESKIINGKKHDVVYMDIISDEFNGGLLNKYNV